MKIFNYFLFLTVIFCGFISCTEQKPPEATVKSVDFNGGQLKIVQFTDIHYVVGSEESAKSLQRMNLVLDAENPDIAIFTGDIVTTNEQQKGWDEVLEAVIARKIPWAVMFGNHDDEYTWTRKQIMEYITTKPYCLAEAGPEEISGIGNYVITVKDGEGKDAAILYCMDSHAYSPIKKVRGYGWFAFDQIEWYRDLSRRFTSANDGKPLPALAFFHIPLYEYHEMATRKEPGLTGTRGENECNGRINTGMYAAMLESGDVMSTFVGHDHDNDYIGNLNGIALAYGRFSGSNTIYNHIGYGARIIVLKEGERSFETWIRTGDGEKIYPVKYPDDLVPPERPRRTE